jgi:hypothetical protein
MRWVLCLALVGCDRLTAAGDLIDGYGDTTVVQGLFLGAEVPGGISIPADSGIYTAACKVFLAEIGDASDFEDSPLAGADVSFMSDETGSLDFDEDDEEAGKYLLTSQENLAYEPGQDATVRFNTGNEQGSVSVRAPEAPEFELPGNARTQQPMKVRITEGDFTNVVAAVYDFDHSILTWDNLPDDVESAYELNQDGVDDPIRELTIPAEAFKRPATYIIGVGGLQVADAEGFEGANRAYSTFAAARLGIRYTVLSGD